MCIVKQFYELWSLKSKSSSFSLIRFKFYVQFHNELRLKGDKNVDWKQLTLESLKILRLLIRKKKNLFIFPTISKLDELTISIPHLADVDCRVSQISLKSQNKISKLSYKKFYFRLLLEILVILTVLRISHHWCQCSTRKQSIKITFSFLISCSQIGGCVLNINHHRIKRARDE